MILRDFLTVLQEYESLTDYEKIILRHVAYKGLESIHELGCIARVLDIYELSNFMETLRKLTKVDEESAAIMEEVETIIRTARLH